MTGTMRGLLVGLLGMALGGVLPTFAQLAVTYVDGDAEYKPDAASPWVNLEEGQHVSNSGYIKTGANSSVELVGSTKVRLLFASNTLARLHLDGAPVKDRVLIQAGQVLAEVLGAGAAFQVRTPTAVMGVRGTQFTVLTNPESGAVVAVKKGKVFSLGKSADGEATGGTLVAAGQKALTTPGGAPKVATLGAQDARYFDFQAFDALGSGKIPTLFDHYKDQQDAFFRAFSDQDLADYQLFVLDDQDQQWNFVLEQNRELADQLYTAPQKEAP